MFGIDAEKSEERVRRGNPVSLGSLRQLTRTNEFLQCCSQSTSHGYKEEAEMHNTLISNHDRKSQQTSNIKIMKERTNIEYTTPASFDATLTLPSHGGFFHLQHFSCKTGALWSNSKHVCGFHTIDNGKYLRAHPGGRRDPGFRSWETSQHAKELNLTI